MTNNTRQILSTLWIFLVANYLFCDVLTLMDPKLIQAMASGNFPGIALDETFLLVSAIVMEIPIAMILLSRLLPDPFDRWTNLGAGAAMTIVQIGSFSMGPTPMLHYWFFSAIEIATSTWIAVIAWRWTTTPSLPATMPGTSTVEVAR